VRAEVSEVAELQKQIRDVELELARIKATHPAEKVRPHLIGAKGSKDGRGHGHGHGHRRSALLSPLKTVLCFAKLTTQRLTISQANQVLDDQIIEMERLNDAITETANAINTRRDEVKGTTKEVSSLFLMVSVT
jgi:hypothetical protein